MKGVTVNKLGGVASSLSPNSPKQKYYKHYRLRVPVWSGTHRPNWEDSGTLFSLPEYTNVLTWLYLGSKAGGANLLFRDDVTIYSTAFSTTMDSFIDAMKNFLAGTVSGVSMSPLMQDQDIVIDISFKSRVYVDILSFNASYMETGWVFYGSQDGVNWVLIHDIPWAEAIAQYDGKVYWGICWFNASVWGGVKVPEPKCKAHKHWGLRFGTSGYPHTDSIRINEIEFLDAPGGTNLCVGGTPIGNVSVYWRADFDLLFDGLTAQDVTIEQGYGVGYEFPSTVEPKAITLTINNARGYHPLQVSIIYSDDKQVWHLHKTIDTPEGTWLDGVLDTVELPL